MGHSSLLIKVSEQGLNNTTSKDIINLACAFWHENFCPDADEFNDITVEQQKIIGYLIEFFSTFNCVENKQAITLVAQANKIKNKIKPSLNLLNSDEIAGEWGIDENLNEYHKEILYYQTRHYRHKT